MKMTNPVANGETKPQENAPAPGHLSTKARRLWEYAHKSRRKLSLDDEMILLKACEAFDTSERARRQIKKLGMVYQDRFGQEKARPEILIEQAARAQFVKFVKGLHLHIGQPWG